MQKALMALATFAVTCATAGCTNPPLLPIAYPEGVFQGTVIGIDSPNNIRIQPFGSDGFVRIAFAYLEFPHDVKCSESDLPRQFRAPATERQLCGLLAHHLLGKSFFVEPITTHASGGRLAVTLYDETGVNADLELLRDGAAVNNGSRSQAYIYADALGRAYTQQINSAMRAAASAGSITQDD